jgi:hypothetical protein
VYEHMYYLKNMSYNLKKGFMSFCIYNAETHECRKIRIEKIKAIAWANYHHFVDRDEQGMCTRFCEDFFELSIDINRCKVIVEDLTISKMKYMNVRNKIQIDRWMESASQYIYRWKLDC